MSRPSEPASEDEIEPSSEAGCALALDAAGAGLYEHALPHDPAAVRYSARCAAILGHRRQDLPADARLVQWLRGRTHPEDVGRLEGAYGDLAEGRVRRLALDVRMRHRDGTWRWVRGRACAVAHGAGGRVTRITGVVQDVTAERRGVVVHLLERARVAQAETEAARRELEAMVRRQEVLLAELDHRVKNMLARVIALASHMRQTTRSVELFFERFLERVHAMARAHSLLAVRRWDGAALRDLIAGEIAACRQSAEVELQGPDLLLAPRAASSLALVLHELAANAVRHGALAGPSGRVEVTWTLSRNGQDDRLVLRWTEHSARPMPELGAAGFGIELLQRALAHELDGQSHIELRRDGILCAIEIPARHALSGHGQHCH